MMLLIRLGTLLLLFVGSSSQPCRVPHFASSAVGKLPHRYDVLHELSPCLLVADFDGDGRRDLALNVRDRKSGKRGIAVWHSSDHAWHVIAAGRKLAPDGDDDFAWMDEWSIHNRAIPVEEGVDAGDPPKLRGDAILAEKQESASGLIFWDGKEYRWYQQRD